MDEMFERPRDRWMQLTLRFYGFHGWRTVWAQDSEGIETECLLIPMKRNGIYNALGSSRRDAFKPALNLRIVPTNTNTMGRDMYLASLTIPRDLHDEAVRRGEIDEDEWPDYIGGMHPYPPRNENYSKTKK